MNTYIQYLNSNETPEFFHNIVFDIIKYLKSDIPEVRHPVTKKPVTQQDLVPLFPRKIIEQEVSIQEKVEIPKEVRDIYGTFRPTPLIRAKRLEEALGTPARIYFKYEGTTPSGSHKINTAIVQAFYSKQEGVEMLTTETGAGQWGTALSMACSFFDLKCKVFMVRISYDQKPMRKTIMKLFGSEVTSSPSRETKSGRQFLEADADTNGSLGMAISEAVEIASQNDKAKYSLGSVLNHVLLHQSVIGLEAQKQMAKFGDKPDTIVGCVGGGSNFAGLAFPYVSENLRGKGCYKFIAVEPEACPSLSKGEYRYDYGDSAGMTPMVKMHTLGHDFVPNPIHAGGLRYHGCAPLLSLLKQEGVIESRTYPQKSVFEAAQMFAQTQGIVVAPESAHAVKAAVDEAIAARKTGEEKVVLFNLSGHGNFDMGAYDTFLGGKLG